MRPVSSDQSTNSEAWVRATKLPYKVPVDALVKAFQIALAGTAGFCLYLCIRAGRDTSVGAWGAAILFLAFALVLLFRSSGLSIQADGLHHAAWFVRKRTLPWKAIASVTTGIQDFNLAGVAISGSLGEVDASKGPHLMILARRDDALPFILNIKPYSTRGLSTLVHFLIHEASDAAIDEPTKKLARGIMPSAFLGEQRGHG